MLSKNIPTGGMLNSLELLTVIDIIKNEELYREKLDEILAADKKLAESRFIAATVEKANKLKEDADKVLALAKEAKEQAEKEAEDILKAAEAQVAKKHLLIEEKLKENNRELTRLKEYVDSLAEREKLVQIQTERNQTHHERLAKLENSLLQREDALKTRKQELEAILRKI